MDQLKSMLINGEFPLVISLPFDSPKLARVAWENGADAIKIHINVHHQASGTVFGSFTDEQSNISEILSHAKGPVGIVAGGTLEDAERDFSRIENAGFDFVSLYGKNAFGRYLDSKKICRMIAPEYNWSENEISEMKYFGADILEASVLEKEGKDLRLNMRDLITYRRLAEISKLPILVPTQHKINPEEVSLLRKSGVSGLMIGAIVTGKEEDSIANSIQSFRRAIDEMKGRK